MDFNDRRKNPHTPLSKSAMKTWENETVTGTDNQSIRRYVPLAVKVSARAANRAAKQKAASDSQEQGLWNS